MQNDISRTLPITGYLDRLSARPGEKIGVKASIGSGTEYEASLVRIVHADPNPEGPGMKLWPVDAEFSGVREGREQPIENGSYARITHHIAFDRRKLAVGVKAQPWLLAGNDTVIMSCLGSTGDGWSLLASSAGLRFECRRGEENCSVSLPIALRSRRWYRIWAGFDLDEGRILLGCVPVDGGDPNIVEQHLPWSDDWQTGDLLIAAREIGGKVACHFNGRLEDAFLSASVSSSGWHRDTPADQPDLIAWWDFSQSIDTQTIVDRGALSLAGGLVNVPTRAVRGSRWDGTEMCWRHRPDHYAAIHFHEDDLYDCGWKTDFSFTVPDGMPSGIYGVRLSSNDGDVVLPFYVLPAREGPRPNVCFLAPTFTYLAYANHARGNFDAALRDRVQAWDSYPYNPDDYPVYGRSTYNFHPDGSGHAFGSRLRPVLTLHPGFVTFVDERGSGLRHFSADSHLVDWLDNRDLDFDVVTDEDLHREGAEIIGRYDVVLTGSHPEYHTSETLDALRSYTQGGGNLIYLGGNGFYWRVAHTNSLPGAIEIRRTEGGIRAWAADPGEGHHQLDGNYGGLWRRNGRPPQALVGVGFSAQGLFEGSYYRRTDASYRPDLKWMFEGVNEERLGDYGLSGGGAAGFELDRVDYDLGSPPDTAVLARSEGHGPSFIAAPEELLTHMRTVNGEPLSDLVRAEIAFHRVPGGGSVLSVGSITFCGSLSHNGYDNDISRFLENAIRGLIEGKGKGQ